MKLQDLFSLENTKKKKNKSQNVISAAVMVTLKVKVSKYLG